MHTYLHYDISYVGTINTRRIVVYYVSWYVYFLHNRNSLGYLLKFNSLENLWICQQ